MGKQNYLGRYFINNVDTGGVFEQEVGECVWQDSENLLCAKYANYTSGTEFHSIFLIPVSLVEKMNWYATFGEFYENNYAHSNGPLETTMTSKERDDLLSITVLPDLHSDFPWSRHFGLTGNCVARLGRCFKEYPDSGRLLAMSIAAETAKHKARKATIEAIAKMIADAGLSAEEMAILAKDLTVEQWLQVRKEEALRIDGETAEVLKCKREWYDPYGVRHDSAVESCVGTEYFVRSPGSDIWVWFEDLPSETAKKINERHGRRRRQEATDIFDDIDF